MQNNITVCTFSLKLSILTLAKNSHARFSLTVKNGHTIKIPICAQTLKSLPTSELWYLLFCIVDSVIIMTML